jgi:hypothetical protein
MTNQAKRLLYDVTRILTARWVSTALGKIRDGSSPLLELL